MFSFQWKSSPIFFCGWETQGIPDPNVSNEIVIFGESPHVLPFQNPLVLRGVEDMWGGESCLWMLVEQKRFDQKRPGPRGYEWIMVVGISYWKKRGVFQIYFWRVDYWPLETHAAFSASSEEGGYRLPWVLLDYGIGMVMPVQIGETE